MDEDQMLKFLREIGPYLDKHKAIAEKTLRGMGVEGLD